LLSEAVHENNVLVAARDLLHDPAGVWGLFQKLATNHMPPRNVYFFATAGALCVVCSMLATSSFPLSVTSKGILFALFTGACNSVGGLLLYGGDRFVK